MPVLLRHQERVASQHEIPAHGGVTGHVGFAISNGESFQSALPAPVAVTQVFDAVTSLREE